jgi:uncharacterized protein (TIGR00369 family)
MSDYSALKERMLRIPTFQTLKYQLGEFGEGTARMTAPYSKSFDGIFESFHGGMLMTLADSCACAAIMTLTGPDAMMTTTDMNIRFLAPALTDVTAESKIIKFGRTLVPVAVTLRDANGKEVAVAQVTYMRLAKIPAR